MKYCVICKGRYDERLQYCPADGQWLSNDPDSLLGKILGNRYRIEELVGHGAMGIVYRARHMAIGDQVAVKLLLPQKSQDEKWIRRFQAEAQALRRLNHPNAIVVHDLNKTPDGLTYLVMEFVSGHTLATELKSRGRFTVAEAFEVLDPMMDVLGAAHQVGVIHRDFKPENIIIGRALSNGQLLVKLVDFGIAKIEMVEGFSDAGKTSLTGPNEWLGTPYYMSPEQRGFLSRDGNPKIDGRADSYAVAVVFYELISGVRPFSGLLDSHQEQSAWIPPPLHELVEEIPQAFSYELKRAMSPDRVDRHENMRDLADHLRSALLSKQHRQFRAAGQSMDITANDEEGLHSSSAIVKDPLPLLETPTSTSNERQTDAVVSEGKLMRRRKPYKCGGVHLEIGELEAEKVFYLLNFFRSHLQQSSSDQRMLEPFSSLFEPELRTGCPKWISVTLRDGQLVLEAYPKPVREDAAGRPFQCNEVVLCDSCPFERCEYWPDGTSGQKFLVELYFAEPIRLRIYEKENPKGAVLEVDLYYEELVGSFSGKPKVQQEVKGLRNSTP